MSNISLIIEERAANIGNFLVGRLLPFRKKRAVGPFVFIDHMGPIKMNERQNLDVLPHPHIGLSTLTYLFEGSIMHRDSMGNTIEIKPGAVNWMTAGKGVVHSERTPEYLRDASKLLHGLQIWVALPKSLEETTPSFSHIPSKDLPTWEEKGINIKLIAGKAFGKTSPVPVHSELYFIELITKETQNINLSDDLYGESALYILKGSVKSEGVSFEPKQILIAKNSRLCEFEMQANTTVYVFGGVPFPEERYMDWNFVSSSKERLQKAKQDWIDQVFPKIEGETDFIPYPQKDKL
jgi:redox-sensitive bicupin YhaK (pirin superfamily)